MKKHVIAGGDICGKSGMIVFLRENGYQTTSWHSSAERVFAEVNGFPKKPDDLGWAVDQHIAECDREFYLKKIFSLWHTELQPEIDDISDNPLFIDSGAQRMLIKEQTLYGNFKGNELIDCFPNPDLVFLIELNVDLSWIWCKGKPEFYEMYQRNPNSAATVEQRFKLFQTDVYKSMMRIYDELKIPVIILPNDGVLPRGEKHEMWMDIISQHI